MNDSVKNIRPEKFRNIVLILLIILVLLGFSTVIENYLNARLFNRISTSVAIFAVLAIGQTLVVLTRNIDLSVGSIVGFTAYFVGQQLTQFNEMAPVTAILLAIGIGAVMGAINGYFVAYLKIPAIIVTLGTLALFRTILVEYSDAQTVLAIELPKWIHELPRMNVFTYERFQLRYVVAGMLFVVITFQMILKYTSFGRKLYAIGSNPEAAKSTGFPI
ncbi:MAG: ABC transporter permease, partial [SAR324 cluster bacterium]|nr:ABC transporter permease [SAR324 cluster bacterium]